MAEVGADAPVVAAAAAAACYNFLTRRVTELAPGIAAGIVSRCRRVGIATLGYVSTACATAAASLQRAGGKAEGLRRQLSQADKVAGLKREGRVVIARREEMMAVLELEAARQEHVLALKREGQAVVDKRAELMAAWARTHAADAWRLRAVGAAVGLTATPPPSGFEWSKAS